jgi:hypothetical protein
MGLTLYVPKFELTASVMQSAVDCGFDPSPGQSNDYEIDIWCLSAQHAVAI